MLTTLKNAFKIKELRAKIFFTFLMLVVIRIGCQIPVPGVDTVQFAEWFRKKMEDVGQASNFLSAITGGSFESMSILALNITPYITSSILMQLLTIAIPKLEEMQKEGEEGRKKIASITRYVTVGLSLIEGFAMAIAFKNGNMLVGENTVLNMITVVATLTAGSAFLMWVGEQITEHGVGNGISIVLVINIISRIPSDMATLFDMFVFNKKLAAGIVCAVIIIAVISAIVVLVIVLSDGVRKIPVQYAKKVQGRRMVGGNSTSIPLKINTAGVIPVIFASSLLQLPSIIVGFFDVQPSGFWGKALSCLNSTRWLNPEEPIYSIGLVIYILLVIFFAYFYTSITFNPLEVAENMKKSGGFIPGIRPGRPTSDYLSQVLKYIIFIGATGLTIICVIPYLFNGWLGASVSFGGTSLIIIVSVILETIKQIESQMVVRNYKGFLND